MSAGRAKNSDHLSLHETARTPPILTGHLHKLGGPQIRSLIKVSYTVNMRERQSATACLVDESNRHFPMPISNLNHCLRIQAVYPAIGVTCNSGALKEAFL